MGVFKLEAGSTAGIHLHRNIKEISLHSQEIRVSPTLIQSGLKIQLFIAVNYA